jgi:DNA polymerase-4/protein ImuB
MKVLCVLLPHFPWRCEVRRHPALEGRPAIVLQLKDTEGSQKLVTDFSPDLEGLRPDMSLQEALARHGEVELFHADIPYYQSVFNEILDALEQKSPLVEGADPGCVYIGVDGLQLIYPDDIAIIDGMRKAIPEDFAPRMGIAENKFLACLAARYSPPGGYQILTGAPDAIEAFLKDLSCDVLPVSAKSRSKLHDFGLATLGQVAALPPGPFQSQFGPEGKRIWELARGHDDTPLYPRFMEEVIEESATLPSVTVSLEAILVALESLLARLFDGNTLKGRGIRSLTLWTRSWNAEHWERNINFKDPAMDVRSAVARIKRMLEDYPQPGPVEQAGMRITRLGYPRGRQKSLFSEVRAQDHLAEDIKQLELKLGNPQVYKVKEVEPWSRIPERRYALTPTNR